MGNGRRVIVAGSRPVVAAEEPFRSEAYLAWVRRQPSVLSGHPSQAHHVIGHGRLGKVKTSDLWTFPLTPIEHDELHHGLGWSAWEERYGSQLLFALRTMEQAVREGILVVAG